MEKDKKIYIAGHQGMLGSALLRALKKHGYSSIITATRHELDLTNQNDVVSFLDYHKPHQVIIAAAKVGGIHANKTYPADFIYENLMIQNNIIHAAWQSNVQNLIFVGSNCAYPVNCQQPMKEEYLLTGFLEPTNEAYAIAKIAGIKMCENYRRQYGVNFFSAIPCSLYGPYDNFDPMNSHVVPGLIRKLHEAKLQNQDEMILWGTGKPQRELMYVDDAAEGLVFLMQKGCEDYYINLGTGHDYTIAELAHSIAGVIGYQGQIKFDISYPDGMPKKLLDSQKIILKGWLPKVSLDIGFRLTYEFFLSQCEKNLEHA